MLSCRLIVVNPVQPGLRPSAVRMSHEEAPDHGVYEGSIAVQQEAGAVDGEYGTPMRAQLFSTSVSSGSGDISRQLCKHCCIHSTSG